MKALTIHQPWAWAQAEGHRLLELRSRSTRHRGELALHAGTRWSQRGENDDRIAAAWGGHLGLGRPCHPMSDPYLFPTGVILAVAEVVDCHPAAGCCPPWGDGEYGGKPVHHIVFGQVRKLAVPVPARGARGLWTVPGDAEALVREQLAVPA